jgi:hypothetical protein
MAISLRIEDRAHQTARLVDTPDVEGLGQLVLRIPEGFLMRGIDPWDHTMFNLVQLRFLVREISELEAKMPDQAEIFQIVRAAAEEAISLGGYLSFCGD